nr:hypothetical protein [uncultured Arsenicibacter sp.]
MKRYSRAKTTAQAYQRAISEGAEKVRPLIENAIRKLTDYEQRGVKINIELIRTEKNTFRLYYCQKTGASVSYAYQGDEIICTETGIPFRPIYWQTIAINLYTTNSISSCIAEHDNKA